MALLDGVRFCSLDDMKSLSTINPAFSRLDDRIKSTIAVATGQVIDWCRRDFVKKSTTEYFGTPEDCGEQYRVYLREPAATNIQVFLAYHSVFTSDDLIGLTNPDYYIEPLPYNAELTRIGILAYTRHHPRSLKIIYDSGYDVSTDDNKLVLVPASIVQATAIQTGFLLGRLGNEEIGSDQKVVRRFDPRSTPIITQEAQGLLRNWKRSLTGSM